jgi:phosphohistidine swiveling domain-containing protein
MKPIYTKYFQREIPLAMVEVWYYGEKADSRQWTKQPQPSEPYLVFENKGGVITTYFDKNGIDWVKKHIEQSRKVDPMYAIKSAERFKREIDGLNPMLKNASALSIKEFEKFAHKVQKAWPWFELVWWYIDLLDELGEKDSDELRVLQEARKYGELYFPNSMIIAEATLEKQYPQLGELVNVLTLQEAITGKIPTTEILKNRASNYYYAGKKLFVGKTKKEIEDYFGIIIKEEELQANELIGRVAYHGKVTGRVRKIISKNQIKDFQDGEVLVAPSTLPEMLPAMKKAIAIISDEGGLISHAAIVARELKKPCIVGTKKAFNTLKDGDLVEVDANKGVVKKLDLEGNNTNQNPSNEKSYEYNLFREVLAGEKFFSESGRAINFYNHYCIVAPYAKTEDWTIKASPDELSIITNNVCKWYYVSRDGSEFDEALKIALDGKALLKVKEKIKKRRAVLVAKLRAADVTKLDNFRLAELVKAYYRVYFSFLEIPAACRVVDRGIRRRVDEKIISTISVPREFTSVTKETKAILETAIEYKKGIIVGKKFDSKLAELEKEFGYLTCGYFNEPPKMIDDYRKLVLESAKNNPSTELKKLLNNFKVDLKRREELVKSLSKEEKQIAKIAAQAAIIKDYSKESYAEIIFHAEKLFAEIAKRTKKDTFFIKQLIPEETIDLLLGKKQFGQEILDRAKKSMTMTHNGGVYTILGEESDLIEKEFFSVDLSSELRGRVACLGKASGIVKVIKSHAEFKKFNNGDVLVVHSTDPHFVVIMKKASAIIAEEGGLTSHVAVISRELGVPTIVGVENVTRILKDGDKVEVDANKGVVKKLS